MKIRSVTKDDHAQLLSLMWESFTELASATKEEWRKTERAIHILLQDPQAGEAYLIVDEGQAIGYMIVCRGFSLDYGGYFTWVEETYLRTGEKNRFRDQRFSP